MSKLIGSFDKSNTLLSSGTQHTIQNTHKSTLLVQESAHLCEVDECTEGELRIENCLSEFSTEEQKAQALRNLGLETIARWGKISGFISDQKDLKEELDKINETINNTINVSFAAFQKELNKKIDKENINGATAIQQILYTNDAYTHIKNLEDALNQLLYKDLTISISCNPNIKEKGDSVDSVTVSWSYNKKNIKTQTLNGENIIIDNSINDYTTTIKGPFKSTTKWTLKAYDGTKNFSDTTTLYFYPAIYYGDSSELGNLEGFEKRLQSSRNTTITVTSPNYIYIYIPYDYGAASFNVGGFDGGFKLVADDFQLPKNLIKYRVYRSDNAGLGTTTIKIS